MASDLAVNARNIAGSYTYTGGDIGYEDFELVADGSFTSWLHQRPETVGVWSLEGNVITVREQTGAVQMMTVKSLSSSEMEVHFRGMKSSAHYLKRLQNEMPDEQ
ncbi:MAG: lipocalin family protein [Pseudomonadota bacterium]